MRVFISYSSPDREIAEEVQLALLGEGNEVFFDKDSLPPGGDYHARISRAIALADILVFLITPSSVTSGSYALTELKLARARWRHPRNRVLPVRLLSTPWDDIPPYLRSVTVLEPSGNVAAEVLAAVTTIQLAQTNSTSDQNRGLSLASTDSPAVIHGGGSRTQIWVAVIGLIGVLGAALLTNWRDLIVREPVVQPLKRIVKKPESTGIKGPDAAASGSLVLNIQCPEVSFTDYSKYPAESTIIRRCPP